MDRRPDCSLDSTTRTHAEVPLAVARRPLRGIDPGAARRIGRTRVTTAHAAPRHAQGARSSLLPASEPPIRLVGQKLSRQRPRRSSARTRSRRSRRSTGGPSDDEGGPATPRSVAWLRAGPRDWYPVARPAVAIDEERRMTRAPTAQDGSDVGARRCGTPRRLPSDTSSVSPASSLTSRHNARGGSTVGCPTGSAGSSSARASPAFPRHISIPLAHARDRRKAHRYRADEHATMADRVVVQFDKRERRDDQAHQSRPARARHACRDRRDLQLIGTTAPLSRPRSTARECPRSWRCSRRPTPWSLPVESERRCRRCPSRSRRAWTISCRGRDHPPGSDPGQRGPSVPAAQAGPRAGCLPQSQP